jgi:hypothetical protein
MKGFEHGAIDRKVIAQSQLSKCRPDHERSWVVRCGRKPDNPAGILCGIRFGRIVENSTTDNLSHFFDNEAVMTIGDKAVVDWKK